MRACVCVCARPGGGGGGGINDKRRSTGCAPICVCLDRGGRVRRGGGSEGRRDVGGCVVYRYSHGRVFAAIFGPFPFGARGAFTVHTSYRLTLTPLTPSRPRAHPVPPRRNGHARCRRLCKRSLSTLWVEVYGWAEGKRNCPASVFLANFRPLFAFRRFQCVPDVSDSCR